MAFPNGQMSSNFLFPEFNSGFDPPVFTSSTGTPTPSIENLKLADLLKNPLVKEMQMSLAATSKSQAMLVAENQQLKSTIEQLRQMPPDIVEDSKRRLRDMVEICSASSRSASGSLAPSDSVSCRASSVQSTTQLDHIHEDGFSSERPEKYPFEVLWNIADCQDDDDACPTQSNPSRPPMHKAIRRTDGTLLTSAEYNHIQSSARQLTAGLLMLPLPKNVTSRKDQKIKLTRTHFRLYHRDKWLKAIHELERRHPVVALCSGHWKAEHILGALLLSKRSSSKRRSHGRDNLSKSDDNGAISADDMAITPTTSNNTTLS
ncbi:hypothetical protein B0H21DRAFT_828475 [Amylocystis lapponica]|nr:hypothetical protein B0H21DRAFT_828475 [Amylocystis lapponica]